MNTQIADSTQVATTYTCLMIILRFDAIIGTQAVTQVPNLMINTTINTPDSRNQNAVSYLE